MIGHGTRVPGTVIGDAGGSLQHAEWAANQGVADIGRGGEVRTAAVLNRLALQPGGPTVLHDLSIPIPGFQANIDHVVVSGTTVTLLDSKVWRPAFYWTPLGGTRRGWSRFPYADKKTLPTGVGALEKLLASRGVRARFATSLMVVWPSSQHGALRVWAARPSQARAITGAHLERRTSFLVGTRPADPHVVHVLASLARVRS